MTPFTSFFVRSEGCSVIFWINSDFVIIFAMLCCPGFRSSTIVGIRTEKSKASPICTVLFRSCALVVCCFTPKGGLAARFARARRDRRGRCVGGFFEPGRGPRRRNLGLDGQGRGRVWQKPSPTGQTPVWKTRT